MESVPYLSEPKSSDFISPVMASPLTSTTTSVLAAIACGQERPGKPQLEDQCRRSDQLSRLVDHDLQPLLFVRPGIRRRDEYTD